MATAIKRVDPVENEQLECESCGGMFDLKTFMGKRAKPKAPVAVAPKKAAKAKTVAKKKSAKPATKAKAKAKKKKK